MNANAALQIAASACFIAATIRHIFWDAPRWRRFFRMMHDAKRGTTPPHEVFAEHERQKHQPSPGVHVVFVFAGAILCLVDGWVYESLTVRIFGAAWLLLGLWELRKRIMPKREGGI